MKISIVTPCFNEEENVENLHDRVAGVMAKMPQYDYEHIYIDNASYDKTIPILREMVRKDKHVKVILNARNFGHFRSLYHGILQANGDAVVLMAADLQDPPDLIENFVRKWEEGFKIVMGIKSHSEEHWYMWAIRTVYYRLLGRLSDVRLIEHFTGFGLYDKQIIEILRNMDDAYPYLRGMISEIGFDAARVEYNQPTRKRGITKNNFYSLFDMAMLGFTSHTKVPLRIAIFVGAIIASLSFLVGLFYLVLKLVEWDNFALGLAPLVVGMFFLGGVQLLFLGIVGEYVGAIYTQVMHRPLVIEKERINFTGDA